MWQDCTGPAPHTAPAAPRVLAWGFMLSGTGCAVTRRWPARIGR